MAESQAVRETTLPAPGAKARSVARQPIEFVTVVLPCLNEEEGVGQTVRAALEGLGRARVPGEVLVVDNGSTDRSVEEASLAGARVIHEGRRGTGAATNTGIAEARGDVIVTADADGTYDLRNLGNLLAPLRDGVDLVVGSRLHGSIERGAMPRLHRYLGTPSLNLFLRLMTGSRISDSQSGYRAFRREAVLGLGLRTPGFESVSELLLRATRAGWAVQEVPSDYRRRLGESKLSTWTDGWKHLRMLLILSPQTALLLPGLLAVVAGFALAAVPAIAPRGVSVGSLNWEPVFIGPLLLILGGHTLFLGSLAAHRNDLTPPGIRRLLHWLDRPDPVDWILRRFLLLGLTGVCIDAILFGLWVGEAPMGRLLGVAGVAQAAIVVGLGGIATVLAADFARESLLGSED